MTFPNAIEHRRSRIAGKIDTRAGGAAWWLASGAIPVFAFQPRGAFDYAISKINLVNPGTYDATDGANYPTWATDTGWYFATNKYLDVAYASQTKPFSVIAKLTPGGSGNRAFIGSSGDASLEIRISAAGKLEALKALVAVIGTSNSVIGSNSIVSFTYSNVGAFIIYLNGASDGSGTNNQTFNAGNTRIGFNCPSSNEYYSGYILAIAKYDFVLTAAQVLDISTILAAI